MKWWPGNAKPGDMIRIAIGPFFHYGVFVSEEEVIQFGPPPVNGFGDSANITVIATDINEFCCGKIVEVAALDKKELKSRIKPSETIRLARSRLGEGGYNLLHNNCEHFANACVFGISRCTMGEEARQKWLSRPICDVYVAPMPENLTMDAVYPPQREKELQKTTHSGLRAQRYMAWKLLQYAAERSFHVDFASLRFKKSIWGKWTNDKFHFSLSHTEGMVAVAVSNGPVGLDMENIRVFKEKFADRIPALMKKITLGQENALPPTIENALKLWTAKESIFKLRGSGKFVPGKVSTDEAPVEGQCLMLREPVYLSLCGEKVKSARYYLFENSSAQLLGAEHRREEIEP